MFLYGTAPTVPHNLPLAQRQPATVSGVLTPANIIGPAAQGVAPTSATINEFAELVELLREGIAYANVQTSKFPGGEIRGQMRRGFGHKDRHDED